MDMTYRVSKNAYIELLADMVRRNDSRPIKLLTTFLLTLGQRLSCPLHAVGPVEERADALYIYCGGTIFDIIPAEAFKNADAMQRFARDLRTAAEQAEMPGEKADAVPTAAADLNWEMDEKQFLDGQFIAFRTLYYRYRFVRRATFIRLRISRELGAWEGSCAFRLSMQQDTLLFASEKSAVTIPVDKINLCEKVGAYYIIAWSSFPAVILPESAAQSPETAALLRRIEERRSST